MIESIDNSLQIVVLVICTLIAAKKAFEQNSRAWTLLAFFFGNFALDDLYLVMCLLTVGEASTLSVVSELSWYASYIFLYMLIRQLAPPAVKVPRFFLPWLGPILSMSMAFFFMQWGNIASNLIYGALMGLVMFAALHRLSRPEQYGHVKMLCVLVLVLCFLEYTMWTISCYYEGGEAGNPYYFVDFLITVSFPFFLRGTRKAVEK